MSFFYKTSLILIFGFFISTNILAATGPEEIKELQEQVYYTVTPENPKIGDTVNMLAEMYGTPVKDADFIWKINGKSYKSGIGMNKISFVLNEKTKVDLKITTGAGVVIEKVFEFDPKKIILVWESGTYTPPFYKGKSFYTPESVLVLNAINLDQENPLTNKYNNYNWSVDDVVQGDNSGVGYSSYIYQGNILNNEPMFKVIVSSISGFKDKQSGKPSQKSEASMRVFSSPSEIISYEKSPLLGVLFNKTIGQTFNFNKSEATIVSYPVYYGLSSSLSGIYTWYLNDTKINNTGNEISFKKSKDDDQSRLDVSIKNIDSILQSISALYIIDTSKK